MKTYFVFEFFSHDIAHLQLLIGILHLGFQRFDILIDFEEHSLKFLVHPEPQVLLLT